MAEATEETVDTIQIADPFSSNSWSETPAEVKPDTVEKQPEGEVKKEEPLKVEAAAAAEVKEPVVEKVIEPAVVEAKKEAPIVKEAPVVKLNPLVERLLQDASDDEVLSFLQTKKELSNIEGLTPAEVLKLQIKHANKDYTAQDIADVFDEKYSIPEKPVQDDIEDDTVFAARLSKWEDAKGKVDRRIERDARTAKTDLSKINGELVFPKAPEAAQTSEQKELDAHVAKLREQFLNTLETDYKSFDGFNTVVTYKDKDVDVQIPIDFKPTEEERAALKGSLETFDSSEYFGSRWFDKDGKPKISQMMQDKALLENRDKIFTKIANDAAAKRLDAFINEQKNIKVNGGGSQVGNIVTSNAKDEVAAMSDFFFSN